MIQSLRQSSTTSRGGVEAVSDVLDSAVKVGGVAYQSPDELITHIAVEGTTISPAVIVLEDGQEYTFKFVDEVNPDGLTLTLSAYNSEDKVVWSEYERDRYRYSITYDPQANTNTFQADKLNWNTGTPMESDVYTPGSVHKISGDVVDIAKGPRTVDIYLDGNTCTCDTPQLLKVWSHDDPIVIRLILVESGSIVYANSVIRDDSGGRPPEYFDSGKIYFYRYTPTSNILTTWCVSILADNSLSKELTAQTLTVH